VDPARPINDPEVLGVFTNSLVKPIRLAYIPNLTTSDVHSNLQSTTSQLQ